MDVNYCTWGQYGPVLQLPCHYILVIIIWKRLYFTHRSLHNGFSVTTAATVLNTSCYLTGGGFGFTEVSLQRGANTCADSSAFVQVLTFEAKQLSSDTQRKTSTTKRPALHIMQAFPLVTVVKLCASWYGGEERSGRKPLYVERLKVCTVAVAKKVLIAQ